MRKKVRKYYYEEHTYCDFCGKEIEYHLGDTNIILDDKKDCCSTCYVERLRARNGQRTHQLQGDRP